MASKAAFVVACDAPATEKRSTRKSTREAREKKAKVKKFASGLDSLLEELAPTRPQSKPGAVGLDQAFEAVRAINLDELTGSVAATAIMVQRAPTAAALAPRFVGEIAKVQAAFKRRQATAVLPDAQVNMLERLIGASMAVLDQHRKNKHAVAAVEKELEVLYTTAEKASRPTSRAVLSRALPDALALPDELWLHIFEMVGPCLSSLAYVVPQVCRHWRELWEIRRSAIVGNVRLWDTARVDRVLLRTMAPRPTPQGVFFHDDHLSAYELPNQERFTVTHDGRKWPEKVLLDGWMLLGPATAVEGDPGAVYTYAEKNSHKHAVYVKGSEIRSIRNMPPSYSDSIVLPNGVLVGVEHVDFVHSVVSAWAPGDDEPTIVCPITYSRTTNIVQIGNVAYIAVGNHNYDLRILLRYCDGKVSAVKTPPGALQDIFVDYEDKKRPRLVLIMTDADSVWASSRVEGEEEWVSLPSALTFGRSCVLARPGRTKSGRTLLRISASDHFSEWTFTYTIH